MGQSKTGRKISDIPADTLRELNDGSRASQTLTEGLAIDFAHLMRACFPGLNDAAITQMHAARELGITKRMALAASLVMENQPAETLVEMTRHRSDTVRGWACYAITQKPETSLADCLAALRPLADDGHFGVREWAWLALRPRIVATPQDAIAALTPWTAEPSENLRRFASEATRPRGVWCSHIGLLKSDPGKGLPILTPLRADPARYVQDSVANWLNDAGKTQPDWLRALCEKWLGENDDPATAYICKRAQRSLKPA